MGLFMMAVIVGAESVGVDAPSPEGGSLWYKHSTWLHNLISLSLLMLLQLFGYLASCTTLILVLFTRCLIKQSHLRKIPGPPGNSLWKGDLSLYLFHAEH